MSEAIVPLSSIDAAEIRERVRAAGVVGAGGAGFPTHIKLQARVDTVLVNAAECEPMLKVDQQLMAQQADRLIRGLGYAMTATGAREGIIALKAKYAPAIAALTPRLPEWARLHIQPDVYPAGDEVLLTAVIRFNAGEPRAAKRYARLARACRFCPPAAGEQEAFQALLTAVETLKQQCAIPTLKGALQEKYPLFLSRIPAMVPAALADATLRTNPRPVDGAAIAQLLESLQ